MTVNTADTPTKRDRPGCVTAYAILLWIGSGIVVLGSLCVATSGSGLFSANLGVGELCLGLFVLPWTLAGIAAGIGIWQMRRWGWALVIMLQALSVVTSLCSAVLFIAGDSVGTVESSVGNIIGIVVSAFVIYWFVKNRELFNGVQKYETVIGPEGETVYQPVEKKSDNTATILLVAGGAVAILVLICIVVIAMLAILGPQIGNVFSQITFELEEPTAALVPWLR